MDEDQKRMACAWCDGEISMEIKRIKELDIMDCIVLWNV